MLRAVDLAFRTTRRQHQVDRRIVSSVMPGLGPAEEQTLKASLAHKADDRVRLSLSGRQDLVSAPQLMVAEIAGDNDVQAWVPAASSDVHRLSE